MLDIDSKQNKDTSEFSFGKVYIKIVFLVNVILFFSLIVLFQYSIIEILYIFTILLCFSIFLIYLLGQKRKNEIEKIASLINSIKTQKYLSVEQISLGVHLSTLESDLKEMFIKNQSDIANIKKLAQTRTDFLGNVSHELRTPIFTIQGFLETLLNGAINDEKVNRRFVEKAMHHTQNLNALLNDLIDISMIESGQMRMLPKYFSLSEVITKIVEEFDIIASQKGIKIKTEFFDKSVQAFGDVDKLKQVFVNLISNALKYSEKENVKICTKEVGDKIEVSIKDKGFGISETDLPRIFERFYRVDKARSKEVGGTGLGLAIAKHITEAHGSKIIVKSTLGKGSIFKFYLRKK